MSIRLTEKPIYLLVKCNNFRAKLYDIKQGYFYMYEDPKISKIIQIQVIKFKDKLLKEVGKHPDYIAAI